MQVGAARMTMACVNPSEVRGGLHGQGAGDGGPHESSVSSMVGSAGVGESSRPRPCASVMPQHAREDSEY
jgi:hypothetical protein